MNGLVFWFTGLSGSGKSTIASAVAAALEREGIKILVLDGDVIRKTLYVKLGFSKSEILENNRLIADLCCERQKDYDVILVPIISPLQESRKWARKKICDKFFEIYFSADLQTVVSRDCKGLYAKAKTKEIDNMIGYSRKGVQYEAPEKPDYILDTTRKNIEENKNEFVQFIHHQLNYADNN